MGSKLPRRIPNDEPLLGPNGYARICEEQITKLEAEKAECRTRKERRAINKRLHTLRGLLAWCTSRAGYVEMPAQ